jgi:hypothetical protein
MTLKFLETSFIPSEILLNVIGIYTDEQMYTALNITNKNINTITINNTNKNYETYNYIKTLKLIITILVKFIIQIEVSLNIQCLLITNFIDKINNKNTHTTQNEIFKPKIFKLFNKSNKDICNNVKSSTLILLLFKLINKLNITTYETNEYMTYLQENNTKTNHNLLNYIKNKHYINKKINIVLDTFILEITNYFGIDKSNENNINNYMYPDIYMICSTYILTNIELIFKNFENIFTILETHLLTSININEVKIKNLIYLKNIITNLADIEIDNIKKLFYL